MHSPTIAVPWELWKRRRWVLIASVAWLFTITILCRVLADGVIFGTPLSVHKHVIIYMHLMAVAPLLYGLLPLFFYSVDADIAGKESTFPKWWFTFPLTTRSLVGWPMLYGTAAIALTWLAFTSLVFRPGGINFPLWWPAMLLASCVAWIQAMSWRPFGLPFLRMVTAVVPIVVLIAISSLGWAVHLPEPVVSLLLGSTIFPAYAVAVAGVARARRGDQPDHRWLSDFARNIANRFLLQGKNFASPSQAQVWFEWRKYGLYIPILAGFLTLFFALLITVTRHNSHSPFVLLRFPFLLMAPPLIAAMCCGTNWGSCGDPRRGRVIPAFLATRPMTCASLVWTKIKAATISVAIAWGITLAFVVLMFLLTGPSWDELARQWGMLPQDFSTTQKVGLPILIALLLPLITWRMTISNMYLFMTGHSWVFSPIAVAMGFVMVMTPFLVAWGFTHPEYGYKLLPILPWVLGAGALLKLILGAWLTGMLVRRQLVPPQLIKRLLVAWILTAIGLSGLFCWLIPRNLVPWYLIIVCVVLAIPLVRISLAPLALAWNRHR